MTRAPTPACDEALVLSHSDANILRRCMGAASVHLLFPDDCKRLAARGLLHWHGAEGGPCFYVVTPVGAELLRKAGPANAQGERSHEA
jgi:hypothetical protein